MSCVVKKAITEVKSTLSKDKVLVSVAAGIKLKDLQVVIYLCIERSILFQRNGSSVLNHKLYGSISVFASNMLSLKQKLKDLIFWSYARNGLVKIDS